MSSDPWVRVPRHKRSIVRAYINSENERDREYALQLCEKYHFNYVEMRATILAEMRAYEAQRLAEKIVPTNSLF